MSLNLSFWFVMIKRLHGARANQRPLLNPKQTMKPFFQACKADLYVSQRELFDPDCRCTHTHTWMQTHTQSSATKEQVSKSLTAARPGRPGEAEMHRAETDAVEKYCCSSPLRQTLDTCVCVLGGWGVGGVDTYMYALYACVSHWKFNEWRMALYLYLEIKGVE